MKSFDAEQINAARALAIAYEAVWDAIKMEDEKKVWNDWNHIRVWCRMLRAAQQEIGTILMDYKTIDRHIDEANRNCSKIEQFERDMRMHGHEDIPPHDRPIHLHNKPANFDADRPDFKSPF